jgi:hypothetical protein
VEIARAAALTGAVFSKRPPTEAAPHLFDYLGPFLGQLAAEQYLTSFANDPPFFAHVPAGQFPAVGLIILAGLA